MKICQLLLLYFLIKFGQENWNELDINSLCSAPPRELKQLSKLNMIIPHKENCCALKQGYVTSERRCTVHILPLANETLFFISNKSNPCSSQYAQGFFCLALFGLV